MSYQTIGPGAIKVQLPEVQQPNDYWCGPGAALSVAAYYGVGPERIEELAKALKSNEKDGTYYGELANFLSALGLSVSIETEMSKERLKRLLDEKVPVVISMQAYASDPTVYDDPSSNDNGHFVVAVGYDDNNFFFMDPSLHGRRGFLSWTELDKRWHENEGSDKLELSNHLGIAVRANGHENAYASQARHID